MDTSIFDKPLSELTPEEIDTAMKELSDYRASKEHDALKEYQDRLVDAQSILARRREDVAFECADFASRLNVLRRELIKAQMEPSE